jgi:hypothetical protein
MEFWLPLVTYSLPVAAGAGVGVGVGIGVGVGVGVGFGVGVGVDVGLEPPPKVLRGEMTHPLIAIESTTIKKEKGIFRRTAHLYMGSLLLDRLETVKRPALPTPAWLRVLIYWTR